MKNKIKYSIQKSVVALVFALSVLATIAMPMTAHAANSNSYRIITKTLGKNTWATESTNDNRREHTLYKIRVEKSGRLSFKLSGSNSYVYIYSSLPYVENGYSIRSNDSYESMSKSSSFAVDKGTYYLEVCRGKCKYTFTAAPSQKNYCMQRAQKLKANKTAKIYFTPKLKFSRWYKISNPRKKQITITLNDEWQEFAIYNAKRQKLSTVEKGSRKKFCTSEAQPKGTYYIRILSDRKDYDYDYYMFGKYITLKWN